MTRPDGRIFVGVSFKLYFDLARTAAWCAQVADLAATHPAVTSGRAELVVLPSYLAIHDAVAAFSGTTVAIGAQDLFWEDRGPFTGAVSGADVREAGCTYVEVGHLERRQLFGEDDDAVNRKTHAAWRNGLVPLLCVGELTRQPAVDAAADCVRQLAAGTAGVDGATRPLVVAYEPAWAIGADQPASRQHIATVVSALRDRLSHVPALAAARVVYGGSAQSDLLSELHGVTDGVFLGRYAHDAMTVKAVLDEILPLT